MARRLDSQGVQVRQQILDAARQLFIDRGVSNTSLKEVAQAAGISPGTLFYYYSSKSRLIMDVTDQHFDTMTHDLSQQFSALQDINNVPQLVTTAFQSIVGDTLRGKLHHYLIEEAVSSDPTIREHFFQKYQEWRQLIQDDIAFFNPNSPDRRVLSHIFLATLDGLVIQAILGVESIQVDDVAAYLAKQITA